MDNLLFDKKPCDICGRDYPANQIRSQYGVLRCPKCLDKVKNDLPEIYHYEGDEPAEIEWREELG